MAGQALFKAFCERWQVTDSDKTAKDDVVNDVMFASGGGVEFGQAKTLIGQWVHDMQSKMLGTTHNRLNSRIAWPVTRKPLDTRPSAPSTSTTIGVNPLLAYGPYGALFAQAQQLPFSNMYNYMNPTSTAAAQSSSTAVAGALSSPAAFSQSPAAQSSSIPSMASLYSSFKPQVLPSQFGQPQTTQTQQNLTTRTAGLPSTNTAVTPPGQNVAYVKVSSTSSQLKAAVPVTRRSAVPPQLITPTQDSRTGMAIQKQPLQNDPKAHLRWPDTLRDYVRRAFESVPNDSVRPAMQEALRKIIQEAINQKGGVLTRNWGSYPLPVVEAPPQWPSPSWKPAESSKSLDKSKNISPQKKKKKKQQKRQKCDIVYSPVDARAEELRRKQRAVRFGEGNTSDCVAPKENQRKAARKNSNPPAAAVFRRLSGLEPSASPSPDLCFESAEPVVGTSQALEKRYLRLTSLPDPSTVRPEPVLKRAVDSAMKKWKAGNYDYLATCEQLKSIRQDLTIQHLNTPFTVFVYETHGRLALENDDLSEFNQCQSQLKLLYSNPTLGVVGHEVEFIAYRVLYYVFTKDTDDIVKLLQELSFQQRSEPAIGHAFQVQRALALNNYHSFFKLRSDCPGHGGWLMDKIVPHVRINALRAMTKAYLPFLAVSFVQSELGFVDVDKCMDWLMEQGAQFTGGTKDLNDAKIDMRQTRNALRERGDALHGVIALATN